MDNAIACGPGKGRIPMSAGAIRHSDLLANLEYHREDSKSQVSPEDVFLAWLLAQPLNGDIAGHARLEIERLDQAAPLGPGPARLRALFVQAAFPILPRPDRRRGRRSALNPSGRMQ
ncbi:hypothetical protein ACQKGL_29425 [Ensifer adhaerens]|uniref:hypothetical protein n=1 Tax=Ensifer adhaerens TaxID=106592 RepID=UPI003CFE3CDC